MMYTVCARDHFMIAHSFRGETFVAFEAKHSVPLSVYTARLTSSIWNYAAPIWIRMGWWWISGSSATAYVRC